MSSRCRTHVLHRGGSSKPSACHDCAHLLCGVIQRKLLPSKMTGTSLLEGAAMLELSHPVIIKPSRRIEVKWQITLCFIYPAVSTPLNGVSIGTWCYFELHELCNALCAPVFFFCLSFLFLKSVTDQGRKRERQGHGFGN